VVVSTVWSVSCVLFFYSLVPGRAHLFLTEGHTSETESGLAFVYCV